jgi:hypothetical protein
MDQKLGVKVIKDAQMIDLPIGQNIHKTRKQNQVAELHFYLLLDRED